MRPRFISLFAGCGGFDLGFLNRGFKCEAALDVDPVAVATYNQNVGSEARVFDLSKGILPYISGPIDVLLTGSPCQGFSTIGKRELNDPRNNLLIASARIAQKLLPRVFIMENVAGVVSGAHRQYWDTVKALLKCSDYQIAEFRVEAESHGLPQIRKRMILIAWQCNKLRTLNLNAESQRRTLRDVLKGVPKADIQSSKLLCGEHLLIAKRIKQGQKLCNVRDSSRSIHTWDIPEVFGKTTALEKQVLRALLRLRRQNRERDFGDADPVRMNVLLSDVAKASVETIRSLEKKGYVRKLGRGLDLTHTFNGKYRRLEWDKSSLTVDTRFGEPRYFLHPDENRGFCVREAARIQGFPDLFKFTGTDRDQFRQIGNAVPPPVAAAVAKLTRDAFFS